MSILSESLVKIAYSQKCAGIAKNLLMPLVYGGAAESYQDVNRGPNLDVRSDKDKAKNLGKTYGAGATGYGVSRLVGSLLKKRKGGGIAGVGAGLASALLAKKGLDKIVKTDKNVIPISKPSSEKLKKYYAARGIGAAPE